jgi:putative ABC transport system permease protein
MIAFCEQLSVNGLIAGTFLAAVNDRQTNTTMFKSFLLIATRNLARHKLFSSINIAGLALGLTAALLIAVFIRDEKQFDAFLPGADQVYRVYNEHSDKDGSQLMAVTAPVYATVLHQDYPAVEQTARAMMTGEFKTLFAAGDHKLYEDNALFVDSNFLSVFPIALKYGNLSRALDGPGSIVISEEMSSRFFGDANPVGKSIQMNNKAMQVKAVFRRNAKFHLQFNYLLPFSAIGLPTERMKRWGWQQFYTYVKLKPGSNVAALQSAFQQEVTVKASGMPNGEHYTYKPFFQPLKDIHLYSAGFKFDRAQRGNITYVRALGIIAIFIILIGCFNFVNLATAKSLQRAKEVGVRKAIGAGRKQLMLQFIGETVFLSLISIVIAVATAILCLPWFNAFTGKNISAEIFLQPLSLVVLAALGVLVGVLAGFYPALVLSGFKPVRVLKAVVSAGGPAGKGQWLRQGLVVVQFSLAVLLIICSVVVFDQVRFMHNKDLGFNKEQIMFFPMRGEAMAKNQETFKNQLLQSPGIAAVSIGYGFPGDAVAGDQVIVPRNGEQKIFSVTQLMVDHDYIKTLGLHLIAGRDFSKEMATDIDHAFIINEKAVADLGFGDPEKALGQDLAWHPWGAAREDSLKTGKIIGVVKDFNYKSLYDKMEPAVLQIAPAQAWKVAIKMKPTGVAASIAHVKEVWSHFNAAEPLEYKFLDENFEKMYLSEDKLQSLLGIFTGIAVFIGCLGLFGLAAYSAERRKKEVGIRKVLGAGINGLVLLLSKDFLQLVFIALLIASPLAWYCMQSWLNNFAYRVPVSWWIFAATGLLTIGIAFITVGFQAIKSAMANPVNSIRAE